MDIVNNISEDIKKAMKNNDKATLTTLRMAKNALQTEKIAKNHDLSEEEIILTLKKFVKQKKDGMEEYKKYGKDDVVKDLEREANLIQSYLPEEMSSEDIEKGIDEIFNKVNPTSMKDMGILMNEANSLFGVKADKALVSKIIKDKLMNK